MKTVGKRLPACKIFFEENLREKYTAVSGDVIESPIKGTHGNTEFLWLVTINKKI
jgi:23S rRNA (cytidine1920-2'-O)/16S rRNA (cytidine1409-2'-O)-methyltransferase